MTQTLWGWLQAIPVRAAELNTNIPGMNPPDNPAGIVANFYQFSLLMAGLLAFGAIVYGGIVYTLSAGNPEKQSEGKDRITQALLGLLLLLGAGLLLHLINPEILASNPQNPSTFLLKNVDVGGIREKAAGAQGFIDYNAAALAQLEAAHTRAVNYIATADQKEAEAKALREEAGWDQAGGGSGKNQIQQAEALEKEAAELRTQGLRQVPLEQINEAAQQGDLERVGIYQKAIDGNYAEQIAKMQAAGNGPAVAALSSAQFEADATAFISGTIDAKRDTEGFWNNLRILQIPFTDITGANSANKAADTYIQNQASEKIKEIAKTANQRAGQYPAQADEIRKGAKSAIENITKACANHHLECK